MEEPVPAAVERSSESVIDNMADHKRKHAMQLLRDAVFEKLTRSRSCNLTPALRSLLERRLLQLVPDFHIPSHPTYALMILSAIRELDEVGGSSEEAISSFIKTKYHDLPLGHKSLLSRHLSRMCNRWEICVDEERRFNIPNLSTNGTEETNGKRKKSVSRRCRRGRKGKHRRGREAVLSGEENQLKRQRHILTEEQGFTRLVQFDGKVIDVGSKLHECSVKVGASHNEADLQQMEASGDRDNMITEENFEGMKHNELQEFSVEEVNGVLNSVEVQETELVENQDMVTEEQTHVMKEITQEFDGGNCSSITPELRTCPDLVRSLDQNVQAGDTESIDLQIQSELHQNQSVEGENQSQEQLGAITEHNHYGSCPEKTEVKVLIELNDSRELENDIVEKILPLEQIMDQTHRQRKRKYQQSDGKSLEEQRRSKRLQMLIEEHESVSDRPSVELDKGQKGEFEVGQDENQQGLQVESMEANSQEKERSNASEEGGEDDANGEQKQSDKWNSEVAYEQTHMPQQERLEVIKVQEQTGCGGTQLAKQNMVEEESPSHNKHSKVKDIESWQKKTAVVAFYRQSKRPENIDKKPLSGGILSQLEKNQQAEMGKGREQTQGTRCQDDTEVEEFIGQDQLRRYGNKHIGEKRVEVTKEATMIPAVTTNKKEEGQSRSRESRPCKDNVTEEGSGSFQMLKGGKLQKNRRIPLVVLALRQSPKLQDKEKGEKPDAECCKLPKGKRSQGRIKSVKKDDIGKPVMSASKAHPELERQNQETPEQQVDVGVEQNREEMQIEVNNEQFEEQEREGGESGNIELECEMKLTQDKNEAKDGSHGTDDTSLRKEKRHQNIPRRPIVVVALRHSPRLQDKEKGERPDGECCKLTEEKSPQEFLRKGNKGNKRPPVKSASPTQPKGQRHPGEQTVAQEQGTGVSKEQSKKEEQMKGHEAEQLEEQEKEANEPQNLREDCEVKKVTADKNEVTCGKDGILKVLLDAGDVCYNPRHFERDVKIYQRRSIRRKESGGLIFYS